MISNDTLKKSKDIRVVDFNMKVELMVMPLKSNPLISPTTLIMV